MFRAITVLGAFLISVNDMQAAIGGADAGVYLLPLECSELLPDNGPFLNFFEAVGRGNIRKDRGLSQRIFKVLAMRERIAQSGMQSHESNPVDLLVRKSLCFFREKKDPLRMIPYDDPQFLDFLRVSMGDLEKKVEEMVFQKEFDKAQRKEYERRLTENQELEDKVRGQAEVDADRNFERLSKAARRKVK